MNSFNHDLCNINNVNNNNNNDSLNNSFNCDSFNNNPFNNDSFNNNPFNSDSFNNNYFNRDSFINNPVNYDSFDNNPFNNDYTFNNNSFNNDYAFNNNNNFKYNKSIVNKLNKVKLSDEEIFEIIQHYDISQISHLLKKTTIEKIKFVIKSYKNNDFTQIALNNIFVIKLLHRLDLLNKVDTKMENLEKCTSVSTLCYLYENNLLNLSS